MSDIKIRCAYTKMVPISELKPHPKNRNSHPEEQIARLARIFEYQGIRHPIKVSNLSGLITAGHGRLSAARKLRMTEFPVDYQDYESDEQEYADLQADNAIALWSELDFSAINADLVDLGPDFDIDLLGIKGFEIDVADKEPGCDEDEVPEHVEPKTKRGDIYQLGRHRLMCGDSTSIDDVERLMAGEKADMVFTDPPYNVAFNGRSGKHDVIKNDDLPEEEFEQFIDEVCQIIAAVNAPAHYIWCNWKFYGILQGKLPYRACIVWAKNVFGLGNGYRHQHEFCLFNGTIDEHIKNESDLWQIQKDANYVHPTQKPVALAERALGNHSQAANIIDLFGGSGSTLIACEKTNRRCFMMELDPHYCDVIVARWEKFTGQKAELLTAHHPDCLIVFPDGSTEYQCVAGCQLNG